MTTLEQYFTQIKTHKLSAAEKNDLYERIIRRTQSTDTPSILQRSGFLTKFAAYSVVLWLLGLSFYIPYLSQHRDDATKQVAGTKNAGVVRADLIAKVVEVEWEYAIEAAGVRISSTDIADGDTIVLSADSKLVVAMGDHMQGTIQGPARFTVHKTGAGYSLSILEWDFVELANIGEAKDAPEVSVTSLPHKYTTYAKAGNTYHLVLTEQNDKPLVLNKWGQDLTITSDEGAGSTTQTLTLEQNKSIDVKSMIVLASGTPRATIATTIAAQTDSLLTQTDTNYNEGFFRGLLLSQPDTVQWDTQTPSARPTNVVATATDATLATSAASTGTVRVQPTIDKKELRGALLPQFVWVDVKYITYYYLEGKDSEYGYAYNNLRQRILTTFDALAIAPADEFLAATSDGTYDMHAMNRLIQHLIHNVPSRVPSYQEKTLHTLLAIVEKLETQAYGSLAWQGLNVEQMFARIK